MWIILKDKRKNDPRHSLVRQMHEAIDFLEAFDPIAYKVPSAALTDNGLIDKLNATGRPVILSTGMSTMEEIRKSVSHFDIDRLAITHATSAYPCDP